VAKGEIASPLTQAGMDIGFAARVPDLSVLSPLVGRGLPALKALELGGHAVDLGVGYADGFSLTGLTVASSAGNLAGDVKVTLGERLGIQAVLDSTRMDGEALIAALSGAVGDKLATRGQPPLVIPPLPIAPLRAGAVIPDKEVAFDGFEALDTDIRLTMAELRAGRAVFREIAGHLALDKGHLVVDQFTAQTPAGRLRLALDIDSRADPPVISVSAAAPSIDLKQFLPLFALTTPISGTLDFDVALRASGRTQHALAASLRGRASAALVDGELDNDFLAATLSDVFQAGRLGAVPGGVGRTKLRCLALRADAAQGVLTIAPFLFDSAPLLVNAAGTVNLDDETAALQVRPWLRNNGAGVSPVRVGGGFRNLQFQADPAALTAAPPARSPAWFGERGGDACTPLLSAVRIPSAPAAAPAAVRRPAP
jgi:AsmA protein